MKIDEGRIIVKIPIAIINGLKDKPREKIDELIEVELVNYLTGGYNSVALIIKGKENPNSSYGYYYAKRKDLEKFLETGEIDIMENKEFNYLYEVEYKERNMVKLIPSNKLFNIGDYLIITSESANYCIVKVIGMRTKDEVDVRDRNILNRRIVSKVEDTYGIKLSDLKQVQFNIKEINRTISDKYLLLLLKNETTPELDTLKDRLVNLLEEEKALKEELEKYE